MSYKITCYCNDETIKKTTVSITTAGTYSGTYGSSSLGDYEEFVVASLDSSWSATFSVTPASGCSFYRWVYRVGSSTAKQQYSYSSTFKYTGGQDIYIKAEGTQDVETWDLDDSVYFGSISSSVSEEIYISRMTMFRIGVFFNYAGTATFYTTGSTDTYGYVGQGQAFDEYDGVPDSYYASDDDGADDGGNFLISRSVSVGSQYYMWVRGYSESTSGYTTVHIDPPARTWTLNSTSLGTVTSKRTVSLSLGAYTLYMRTVTFSTSGTAKFYTTGSTDTRGYLSTSDTWDNSTGRPTSYVASNDDYNNDANFTITYDVTAGTTYYIWVRCYGATDTGSATLVIEPPVNTWTVQSYSFGTISSEASASFTLGTKQMRRYSVSFENSGSANFFTMGDEYTWGYLSTTTGFDSTNGMPTSYLAEDGTSGPGDNFAIIYNVTAGVTYYIWVCEVDGNSTGTIELYVQPPEKVVARPNDFAWTYSKVQGGTFNLTATEWNNLATRINEFRAYKGLSNYSFTTAYSGNNYMAYMYNQARTAIQGISGYGTYIPSVSSGDTVTAYMMNVLVSELNSIP